MNVTLIILLSFIALGNTHLTIEVNNPSPAIDYELHEKMLNAEECQAQIKVLQSNSLLLMQFADAGLKMPRGITEGNLVDLGNYHQCLGIRHDAEDVQIQGKYCRIQVPTNQNLTVPWTTKWSGFDPTSLVVGEDIILKVKEFNFIHAEILRSMGMQDGNISKSMQGEAALSLNFDLAVCIPKPCTTEQAISSLFFNVSVIGFRYADQYCRISDDKPWSPADTVATVIFSVIGFLTLLCTGYDLINKFLLKKDSKSSHPLYTSFSVYTNGRRLMTFTSTPATLHCLDGIRALAMAWVVIGHAFGSVEFLANPIESLRWMTSIESIWITSGTITVDTFFCLAGLVLVYTTVGKMSGAQLIKNLPVFYLNRILRLMPLLAVTVLLQASYLNWILDGPVWTFVENQTNWCRSTWWLTLLHVQNFINPEMMCIPHSWYVAIDLHCYFVSPLVLFWVLGGSRKAAWIALTAGLLAVLTAATVYNFINNFASGIIQPGRTGDLLNYMVYYYFNTLTRASPFFVGMIFGYVLHLLRGKKLQLSWVSVLFLWACAATVSTTIFFYPTFIADFEWDNQFVDNLMNSFMRPAWSAALCWMIIACVHGYAGPINWFLTLDIWKLPARISYAIFLLHYPIMFTINSSGLLAPIYFTPAKFMFKFLAHITLYVVIAYFATLLIDSPFSTICKQLLGGDKRRPANQSAKAAIARNADDQVDNIAISKDLNVTAKVNDGNGVHVTEINEILQKNGNSNTQEKVKEK